MLLLFSYLQRLIITFQILYLEKGKPKDTRPIKIIGQKIIKITMLIHSDSGSIFEDIKKGITIERINANDIKTKLRKLNIIKTV